MFCCAVAYWIKVTRWSRWPLITVHLCVSGRKMKRFAGLKVMGLNPSLMFQGPLSLRADGQTVSSLPCMPAIRELQLSPQIISVLESIEPQVVYSGYDNSQPELPHVLLNSLNRLCERQLLWIVRWSKSLPGSTLTISLIQIFIL